MSAARDSLCEARPRAMDEWLKLFANRDEVADEYARWIVNEFTDDWDFDVTLTCGCKVDFGRVHTSDCERLTPRRKDGHFGSLRCLNGHGRRRVVVTSSHSTGIPA